MGHHIGDDCPGGHLFDLVDILETTVERWVDGIKQHRLDTSVWKCVDDLRAIISKYARQQKV